MIEDEYRLRMLEAEVSWVEKTIQEIHDGTLTEVKDKTRQWKITHPETSILPIVNLPEQEEVNSSETKKEVLNQGQK